MKSRSRNKKKQQMSSSRSDVDLDPASDEDAGPSEMDEELQQKVVLQQQMLALQQHQQQAAAAAAVAAVMSQQGPPQPPLPQPPPPPPSGPNASPAGSAAGGEYLQLMEKVQQQQQLLEAEKQQQMLIKQQQRMILDQHQADEAEMMRQQQLAIIQQQQEAAQKEEQQKFMHHQMQSAQMMPIPPPPPPQSSENQLPPPQFVTQASGPPPPPPPPPPPTSGLQPPGPPQSMAPPPPPPPSLQSIPPPPQGIPPPPPPQGIPPPHQGVPPPQGMPPQPQGMPPPPPPQIAATMTNQPPPQQQNIPPPPPPSLQPPMSLMTSQPNVPIVSSTSTSGNSSSANMIAGQSNMGTHTTTAIDTKSQTSERQQKEIKLPQALEKILAFMDVRAQEIGAVSEDMDKTEVPENQIRIADAEEEDDEEVTSISVTSATLNDADEEDDDIKSQDKAKENRIRKKKKKKKNKKKHPEFMQDANDLKKKPAKDDENDRSVEIEYVQEQLDIGHFDVNYHVFAKIFENFKIADPEKPKDFQRPEERREEEKKPEEVPIKARGLIIDDDEDLVADDEVPKLSKKKLKKLTRLSIAQLKQLVSRPDVVEMHDATAQDPRLLVQLKATRNTVPVPRHWCFKSKYLQGKRGIEKPPFELPDFIKATGIMEMRAALAEKEDQKTLKAKMREKVRPKLGKIDIDYQKLHDAFFRWQTKPKLTIHGDLYYEGKEFETRLKEKKPGNLSDELRTALGMPVGPNSEKVPPPWLIAMQRYGPPPSYPNLKIPGLNAPIPESCSFGYHAGGWGKPPVDESGKPLYGDVFGTQSGEFQTIVSEEEIDKTHWGELESESECEESEEESSEEELDTTGLITPGAEGLVTPSGITSVPMGVETPDMIELRKKRIEDAIDQGGDTPALYTILPEKKTNVGANMMGSAHIYDMSAVTGMPTQKRFGEKGGTEAIEVALNPEELDMDSAAMQAKYEQTMREQQSQLEKEDLTDMVAEHAAKQRKRKRQQQDSGKAKKYKEFKF
ncbi:splicing factor 3B subunit 2 [Octopus sinensis]|uniref:Splicing factor 3B subunit 2 n=1 Tax=Octopus sinensis TaxID=2607531 RepID=A0A6P7S5R9_9MOLL|nr:splicing factor 3B subunit 2 [Octopus sinensis]XP_036356724.1 splicing factor 3B subunit 2 [Octopus sinensis]